MWSSDSSGKYSVKSMVELVLNQQEYSTSIKTFAWKGLAPPRVQSFMWCALREKVLTKMDLKRRGLLRSKEVFSCLLCDHTEEDLDHLFINCSERDI